MKTLLGKEISTMTRGVVYMCKFNFKNNTIKVTNEIFCYNAWHALELYANIPNPESQIATGKTYKELCKNLEELHRNMKDKKLGLK